MAVGESIDLVGVDWRAGMFRRSVARSLGSFEMSQSNRGSLFFFFVVTRGRGGVVD